MTDKDQRKRRKPDFRCALHRWLLSGLSGLLSMQRMLTQHLLARAAKEFRRRSDFPQTSHSKLPISVDLFVETSETVKVLNGSKLVFE
jgi:hypothetical protein